MGEHQEEQERRGGRRRRRGGGRGKDCAVRNDATANDATAHNATANSAVLCATPDVVFCSYDLLWQHHGIVLRRLWTRWLLSCVCRKSPLTVDGDGSFVLSNAVTESNQFLEANCQFFSAESDAKPIAETFDWPSLPCVDLRLT